MRLKLAKWGNSLALRLPKPLAATAGLSEGQEVDVMTDGTVVELRPVKPRPRYTLEELVAEMKRLGPENQPPFEDWGILPSEWPNEDWSDIAPKDDEPEDRP